MNKTSEIVHTKKNPQTSGIKNCHSMKEIMDELTKIVDNSFQKETVTYQMEEDSNSRKK